MFSGPGGVERTEKSTAGCFASPALFTRDLPGWTFQYHRSKGRLRFFLCPVAAAVSTSPGLRTDQVHVTFNEEVVGSISCFGDNRIPTNFARFDNSPVISFDRVLFDDGQRKAAIAFGGSNIK